MAGCRAWPTSTTTQAHSQHALPRPARRRQRAGGPGDRRARRGLRAGRRVARGVCRGAARGGAGHLRAAGLRRRSGGSRWPPRRRASTACSRRAPATRSSASPRIGPSQDPDASPVTGELSRPRRASRGAAGRVTARGCSTPPSTPCGGPGPTGCTPGCWPPTRRPAAFLLAGGLRPDGAFRDRVVSPDGDDRREVRLVADRRPRSRRPVSASAADLDAGGRRRRVVRQALSVGRGDRRLRHQLRGPVGRRRAVDPADPGPVAAALLRRLAVRLRRRHGGRARRGAGRRSRRRPCSACATASTACRSSRMLEVRGLRRVAAAQLTIDESTAVGRGAARRGRRAARVLGHRVGGLRAVEPDDLRRRAASGDAMGDPRRYGLDAAAAAAFCALLWPRLKSADAFAIAAAGRADRGARRAARPGGGPGARGGHAPPCWPAVSARAHHDPPAPHEWPTDAPTGGRGRA